LYSQCRLPQQTTDGISRSEDAIIAYTWWHFLTQNISAPYWLLRMPMTKASVKAMDAIQALTSKMNHIPTITNFVVAGASKRGWTTWTTAVVDPRVSAIVPIVIPILNMVPNLNHQVSDFELRSYTAHISWFSYCSLSSSLVSSLRPMELRS